MNQELHARGNYFQAVTNIITSEVIWDLRVAGFIAPIIKIFVTQIKQ